MGRPKALLPLTEDSEETFIGRLVKIAERLSPRVGVVSSLAASTLPVDCPVIPQPRPEDGQLSSLLLGWQALGGSAPWVMSCLVDHPYVRESTLEALIAAIKERPEALLWSPSYQRRGGHPVIFSAALMPRLEATPIEEGARPVVRSLSSEERHWVETDDETVCWDVDTPADYLRYSKRWLTLQV